MNPTANFIIKDEEGNMFTGPASSPVTLTFSASSTTPGTYPLEFLKWDFSDGTTRTITRHEDLSGNQSYYPSDVHDPRNYNVRHTFYETGTINLSAVSQVSAALSTTSISLSSFAPTPASRRRLLKSRSFGSDKLILIYENDDTIYNQLVIGDKMVPIRLEYPYDPAGALQSRLTTFTDGFSGFNQNILKGIHDISINRSTLMFMTSAHALSRVFNFNTSLVDTEKLEVKSELMLNGNYLAVLSNHMYTLPTAQNTFFRFSPIGGGLTKIYYKNKVLTSGNNEVYFADDILEDTANTQKFICYIDGSFLRILTKNTNKFLSVNPDTSLIEPIGDLTHPYEFTLLTATTFDTNFNANIYWVKYFGDYSGESKTINIDPDKSIKGTPLNFMVFSPYKTISYDPSLNFATMKVNLCNLKNFQTPEYKYAQS